MSQYKKTAQKKAGQSLKVQKELAEVKEILNNVMDNLKCHEYYGVFFYYTGLYIGCILETDTDR